MTPKKEWLRAKRARERAARAAKTATPQVVQIPQAKTILEAEALAVQLGIAETAYFGDLDVETANEMIFAIKTTMDEFPGLEHLDFIGSMTEGDHYFGSTANREEVGGVFYRKAGWTHMEQGISIADTPRNIFTSEMKDAVENLYHPVGCNTIKSVVDHEIGHWIDYRTDTHDDIRVRNLFNSFYISEEEWYPHPSGLGVSYGNPKLGPQLSNYASKSVKEFVAECWSEARNNPNPRPLAREVSSIMIERLRGMK